MKRLRVGKIGVRGVLGGGWGALCLDDRLRLLEVVEVVEIIYKIRDQRDALLRELNRWLTIPVDILSRNDGAKFARGRETRDERTKRSIHGTPFVLLASVLSQKYSFHNTCITPVLVQVRSLDIFGILG